MTTYDFDYSITGSEMPQYEDTLVITMTADVTVTAYYVVSGPASASGVLGMPVIQGQPQAERATLFYSARPVK